MSRLTNFIMKNHKRHISVAFGILIASCSAQAPETNSNGVSTNLEQLSNGSQSYEKPKDVITTTKQSNGAQSVEHAVFQPSPLGALMMGGLTGELLIEDDCLLLKPVSVGLPQIFGVAFSEELDSISFSEDEVIARGVYKIGSEQSFSGGTINITNTERLSEIPKCYNDQGIELIFLFNG